LEPKLQRSRKALKAISTFLIAISCCLAGLSPSRASTDPQEKSVVFVGADNRCAEPGNPHWSEQLANWNNWQSIGQDCFSSSFLQYPGLKSIGDFAPKVAALNPAIVVISAGGGYTKLRSNQNVTNTYPVLSELQKYRKLLPKSALIVLGAWSTTSPPSTLTNQINELIETAATTVQATFINTSKNNKYLLKNTIHKNPILNPIGQVQLALMIQNSLPARLKDSRKTALFIGDSYTAGTGASTTKKRWSSLIIEAMDWHEINFGIGGTGYIRGGNNFCGMSLCPNYDTLIRDTALANPDYVFIAGGQNDQSNYISNPQVGKSQILKTFLDLKERFPNSTIIAVGPSTVYGNPPARSPMDFIIKSVEQGADSIGATKVSLLNPPVLTQEMLAGDKVHPNDLGHKAIADKILSVINPK